jgi:Ca2+-binding EF-hand superfamily protein
MKDLVTNELAELRESFDLVDSDGDGWIASAEFQRLLQGLDHDLSADECLLAFELTDEDGDEAISFEEFMGWWTGE